MKLRHSLAGLLIAALAVPAFARVARAADGVELVGTDVSAYPAVTIEVDVPAEVGQLAPGDFLVKEDGVAVPVTATRLTEAGLEVVLVMDTSNSMAGSPLEQAKAAAGRFLAGLPEGVAVGIVSFGSSVEVRSTPTTDRVALAAAIDALRTNGGTRLYDALVATPAVFTRSVPNRAIVVLSDGGDTDSTASLEAASAAITGVHVEVVSLETSTSNALALARLAIDGRGTVASAADPAGLTNAYATIATALQNRYQLTYTTDATTTSDVVVAVAGTTLTARLTLPDTPPAAPASTAAPSPSPTVAPATTVAPASLPTPPLASTIVPAGAPSVHPPAWQLYAGLGAVFGALLVLGLVAMPGPVSRRRKRQQLGLLTGEAPGVEADRSAFGERIVASVERVLKRGRRGERLAEMLEVAGVAARPAEFVTMVAVVAVVASMVGLLLGGIVLAVVFAVLTVVAVFGALDVKGSRRRTRFAEHLPDVLQLMVSSLRTGYGLQQAIDAVAVDAPEPIASELRRAVVESRLGRDLAGSLEAVASRMQSPDFEMVVAAVRINRQVGGNLAEVLDNVGQTIRDRQRTARQVQALIGEGKMSAYVLTALPLLLGGFMRVRNPQYFDQLLHGGGLVALIIAAALLVVGWVWFQKLVRIKF